MNRLAILNGSSEDEQSILYIWMPCSVLMRQCWWYLELVVCLIWCVQVVGTSTWTWYASVYIFFRSAIDITPFYLFLISGADSIARQQESQTRSFNFKACMTQTSTSTLELHIIIIIVVINQVEKREVVSKAKLIVLVYAQQNNKSTSSYMSICNTRN